MASDVENELASFHQFLGQQLASRQERLSPEEALDLWREQNPDSEADADATEALREALDELAAGQPFVTAEDFDREFRRRHKLDRGT